MRLAATIIALALAGCQQHSIRPPDLGPLAASCSLECKTSCLPEIIPGRFDADGNPVRDWPTWKGDPFDPSTWDALGDEVISAFKTIALKCDAARNSCVAGCMQGLEDAGVVCGITRECK